jgi:hypothetical protein
MINYIGITVKEYPDLSVRNDGKIFFDENLGYPSSDCVHVSGQVDILEPSYEYQYVKT